MFYHRNKHHNCSRQSSTLKQFIIGYKTIKCKIQLHLAAHCVLSNNKHNKDDNVQH